MTPEILIRTTTASYPLDRVGSTFRNAEGAPIGTPPWSPRFRLALSNLGRRAALDR